MVLPINHLFGSKSHAAFSAHWLAIGLFMFALYPATVQAQTKESILLGSPTSDGFGWVTTISGRNALVSAMFADSITLGTGAVYAYEDTPLNGWSPIGMLSPSDGLTGDQFGRSMSMYEGTAVIGSPLNVSAGVRGGAAYIFVKDAASGLWNQSQKILSPNQAPGIQFGKSVAMDKNTLLISAWRAGNGLVNDTGAVYLYKKDPITGVWLAKQRFLPSDGKTMQRFGTSVAIKGNVAVVGSYWDLVDGYSKAGSAYVFEKNPGSGIWAQTSKIQALDDYANNFFGGSVDTNGRLVVVGARENSAAAAQAGSAYVFSKNQAGLWQQRAQLTAADAQIDDRFGRWVSITGNVIYSGALRADYAGLTNAGAVYRFDFNPDRDSWIQSDKIMPTVAAAADHIGARIDSDGKQLIVGAGFGHGAPAVSGKSYIYSYKGMKQVSVSESWPVGSLTSPRQTHATIATLQTGVTVTAWSGNGGGIWYRISDENGVPKFTERQVPLTNYTCAYVDIVNLGATGFGMVWSGDTPRGKEPFLAIFNNRGDLIVPPFSITQDLNYAFNNSLTAMHPDMTKLPLGELLVTWDTIELGVRHVYMRKFNSLGFALSSADQLDTNQTYTVINKEDHGLPDIDANANGDVVVAWGGQSDGYGQIGITYRTFNTNDVNKLLLPEQWLVNPAVRGNNTSARVMVDIEDTGKIAATWVEKGGNPVRQSSYLKTYQPRLASWGTPLPLKYTSPQGQQAVNDITSVPIFISPTHIFVSWGSAMPNGSTYIVGQVVDANSKAVSPPFALSSSATATVKRPAIAADRIHNQHNISVTYETTTLGIPMQHSQKIYIFP